MIFNMFVRACKKYKFTFSLSTYGGLTLILRPNNTFENIKIERKYLELNSVFLIAIQTMKEYRKERRK